MKNPLRITTLVCGLSIASMAPHALGASRYIVTSVTTTELGTLGGAQSMAYDINNAGAVVGWAETGVGVRHAALFELGAVTDLGVALGDTPSEARGINSSRTVVGYAETANGARAFRSIRSALIYLNHGIDTDPTIRRVSYALAISDSGLIAGYIAAAGFRSPSEATVWVDADTYYNLTPIDDTQASIALDINNENHVTGMMSSPNSGVRWNFDRARTTHTAVPPPSGVGTPVSDISPVGINHSGAVAGWVSAPTGLHAFYWDGTSESSTDLGVLPTGRYSIANDINNNGFIVGYSDQAVRIGMYVDVYVDSAFIHHPDFGMRALPKPASIAFLGGCRATALNDHQNGRLIRVVGHCQTTEGWRAVRWDVTVLRVVVI